MSVPERLKGSSLAFLGRRGVIAAVLPIPEKWAEELTQRVTPSTYATGNGSYLGERGALRALARAPSRGGVGGGE